MINPNLLEIGTKFATYTPIASSIFGAAEVLYALASLAYLKAQSYFKCGDFARLKLDNDTLSLLGQEKYELPLTEKMLIDTIKGPSEAALRIFKQELDIRNHLLNGFCRITWIGGILFLTQPIPNEASQQQQKQIEEKKLASLQKEEAQQHQKQIEEDEDHPCNYEFDITPIEQGELIQLENGEKIEEIRTNRAERLKRLAKIDWGGLRPPLRQLV